jgi:tRNA-specific 2-thiouridylase
VIEGESVKIFATIPLPNKIYEREMDKIDIPGTFNAGATLGPVNETNMDRIWNKHKQTNTPLKRKVFVAISGGVDSSVAALLLKKAANPVEFFKLTGRPAPKELRGYDVAGGFIRGYNIDGCQDRDAEDARMVCEKIGIPFYVFNFEDEYKKRVVDYLLEGYKKGITPNPDVVCNREIKFGLLYDKAMELGFDYVASGHYARLRREIPNNKFQITNWLKEKKSNIYIAKDRNKDQSYFLWNVPKEKLEHLIFPLGNITKPRVRKIAKKANLPVADKKDSQGVCFLGKFDFGDFLRENIKMRAGNIMDTNGDKVGEHDGVWFYTIGQKHGFKNFSSKPFYVIGKDLEKNELIVAYDDDSRLLYKEFGITELNFLDDKTMIDFKRGKEIKVQVRNRYRQPLFRATLACTDLTRTNSYLKNSQRNSMCESAIVRVDIPHKLFPASGQSAVFYNKNGQMLGGGIIV